MVAYLSIGFILVFWQNALVLNESVVPFSEILQYILYCIFLSDIHNGRLIVNICYSIV